MSATITNASGTVIATDSRSLPNYNLKGITLVNLGSWDESVNGVDRRLYGFRVDTRPEGISRNDLCFNWNNQDSGTGIVISSSATIETGGYSGTIPIECTSISILPGGPGPGWPGGPGGGITLLSESLSSMSLHPSVPYHLPDYALVTLPAGNSYTGTISCTVRYSCGISDSGTSTITNITGPTYTVAANPLSNTVTVHKISDSTGSRSEPIEVRLYASGVPVRSQQASSSDTEIILNTSGMTTGIYQVVILKGAQLIQSQSIVIN